MSKVCQSNYWQMIWFSSESSLRSFLHDWGVHLRFRCAYAPARNGIVERSHRSIKTIVARKPCSIPEVVSWYNITPKDCLSPTTASADAFHRYHIRVWGIDAIPTIEPDNTGLKLHMGGVWANLRWARLTVCCQYKLMETCAMWRTCIHLWNWNLHLDVTVIWKNIIRLK